MMTKEEVLAYIIAYKQANDGLSPSMREIMAQGVSSTSMVDYYLKKLETAGKITVSGVRGIKVTGGVWMNKQTRWEIFFAMLAVGIMLGVAIAGIGYTVINMDVVPHQVYTLDGVKYDCAFPAPDPGLVQPGLGVMECVQVDDPDVGFGRSP